MNLFIERWTPTIGGGAAAVLYYLFMHDYKAPSAAKDLLAAVVSISGILVGFLATAKAILITIDKKRIIQQLKQVGYYNNLVDYLLWAICWSFLLALSSAAGIILDVRESKNLYPACVAFWIYLLVGAIVAYFRVIRIFAKLLRADDD